jgi:hypothetical protein
VNKSFKKILLSAIIAGTSLSAFASGPDISGYFDLALYAPKGKSSYFRQQHLNLLMQHQVDKFRFFAELEFEDAPDIDYGRQPTTEAPTGRGRIFMERAYGEMALTRYDNIRIGQMLTPTYYYLNHYPSVIVNYTNPMTYKTIFNYNEMGAQLVGGRKGFQYNIWAGKGPSDDVNTADGSKQDESGANYGAKFGYTVTTRAYDWTLNFLGESYSLGDQPHKEGNFQKSDIAMGSEFILNYGDFTIWSEFGTRTMKDTTDTLKNSMMAYYVLMSYNIPVGKKVAELIPFFMIDGYKQKEESDHVKTTAVKRWIAGITYRPVPAVSWKLEYTNGGSYKPAKDSGALVKPAGGQRIEDKVVAQFIYFYN